MKLRRMKFSIMKLSMMKFGFRWPLGGLLLWAAMPLAVAQTGGGLELPRTVEAGSAFSIPTSGSGRAVLYLVGPAQVLRRELQLGESVAFAAGDLHNAGHYLAVLVADSATENGAFDVLAAQPASLSFLAKPSRLAVDLQNGISGVVYVFDTFRNLVVSPTEVSFQLSGVAGAGQARTVTTRDGVGWTKLNSAAKEGTAQFIARDGAVSATRVIQQVPGDPCRLRMSARVSSPKLADPKLANQKLAEQRLTLETEPVRDCGGNAVPDGTIVSFKEIYKGGEATVDVPVKRGVARTEMPAYPGATISVATGVVMGNEIRWK
jgi:hypothetical protein